MISENIINCVLSYAPIEEKDFVIKLFLEYINRQYNGDNNVQHILDLMLDNKLLIKPEQINIDYIKNNLNLFVWNYENYNIKDITLRTVDNIGCVAIVDYKYLEKINEDREDVTYSDGVANISFIDYPQMLKKS